MQQVVINSAKSEFGLSQRALDMYLQLKERNPISVGRSDPDLVFVVMTLGGAANAPLSNLIIINVPDGALWSIDETDQGEQLVIDEIP